ncbi:gliding motility-associated-like protein [Flavobacterium cutihirudinis]|uniref:Gliding motility-associated-like protein n=1 Tax=Flavobacterium cutihirudinis TaxID=1265740 RepID=A0A3D9G0Q8_9FLAO|nr:gliding motility-associated C-terminal domain-containing protein [Flavobacterium cutihirudinis]RED26703.1 gliding motility-associated-like protein [Flavobacterium cutihirudinis]
MKKKFTFYDLLVKKRLFSLLFLLLFCNLSIAQTFCRPDSQTNSTGGLLCVGMSVTNPNNAFDSSMSTYASITNVLGLGCFAQETLHFNQTAMAGDQIVIYLGEGNGLLDVGVLANATIQAKNGTTNVGSPIALNDPILNLNLLSGGNIAVIKYTLPGNANQVQIQSGGLLSALVNLRIYDVRLQFATPTIAGGETQSVCFGQSIALSATPVTGTTIAWYDTPTATTPLSTTSTYTPPALTATTTYYVSTSRNAGCESDSRLPVTINVIEPIQPSISATGTSICSSSATQATTLSVINPVPGTTYSWYNVATGGTALTTNNTYTPTVPVGVTDFYVEAAIGSCKSARTKVSVTSTPVPGLATVLTQSVSILSGQNATLSASTSEAGVVLDWYDVPTGGTKLLGDSNTFTTPILTATKTYYIESRNSTGGCVSASRVPVTITVLPNPLGTCLEANSQQTSQFGICLLCSTTTPNNSVDGNPATFARLTLPAGLLNGWIQQTLQFNNSGKKDDIIDVELALPGGIADVSLLGAVSLATYNGSTFNNDRVFINNTLVSLQLLSGDRFRASIVAGGTFDRVEIRLGGTLTVLTNLDIYQATYRYKAPTVTGNKTICAGQTTTLTANLEVGETVNWYDAITGGNLLTSTAAYTTSVLNTTTTFYTEITRNGCVNSVRNPVIVTVNNPVAPSTVVASPSNLCSGASTTITIQSPVAGTTYNWYDAATGGNLVFTGEIFATPNLTATTTYHVEAVIGTCVSTTRTAVSVNVNARPAAPVPVSSNVVIQSGQNVTLAVTNTPGFTYTWYDVATGGASLATGSTYSPSPALTANKTFYVEARDLTTDCPSSTRAAITVTVINTVSSCLQPSTQAITVDPGLLCVACNGINGPNAVDTLPNTFSSLTITAGVLNSYIQQELTFLTPGQTGDIIDVELELPGGLADIALLGSVSIGTSNLGVENPGRLAVNNNLLNLQVLSGNRFKVSYPATAAFDRVDIRLGALVGLLTTLNVYGASYRFPNATITGASSPICSGGTATLTATSTGSETFTWYDAPTGGNPVAVNPTSPLTANTTYYLEAARGTCINSVRQPVTVNVLAIPTANDITITSPLTASCAGGIVLTPTSALAGATFKYYTTQNKTTEIVTGTVGNLTYSKDPVTGALTISGLTRGNAPYTYYVSVLNGGVCENPVGSLKPVVINFPAASDLTVTSPLIACAKASLKDAITNFDNLGNTTYTFFDSADNPITEQAATNILSSGNYFIQAQTNGVACPSAKLPVTVTVNPLPTLTGVTSSIAVTKGTSVALAATSNGTITWYDPQGNVLPSNNTGVLNTVGTFTYTVIASIGTCTTSQTVTISVIDPATCDSLFERVYATTQSSASIITGGVSNGPLAVDGDPSTYSTITTGLGLLGIGTTWQNLQWPTTITKGTPVTVKVGLEYSALAVGQSLTVIGTKRNASNNPIDIGTLQTVSGSLLNLLPGQNSFEFTFVPSNNSGPQDYDGIRVQLGSIASLAQNVNVYDAHYEKKVDQIVCGQGDIEDIFYGVEDLGLGVLTSTVGVSNAWNVADGDVSTYATMFNAVGVLANAQLSAKFRTPSMVGDTLRIVISKPGTVLSLGLLNGFTVQLYSGNIAVGGPITNSSGLLTLKLLSADTMAMTLIAPQTQPYDKVVISLGGVATVLDQLRVHTIDRTTNTEVIGGDPDNKVTVCPGTDITLKVPPKSCADYVWYDSPTGGNVVASGQTFTLPATIAAGTYKYYVQPIRYGCAALERGLVTVVVTATTPAGAITNITVNGGNSSVICAEDGKVTLDAVLSGTPVLANPVYSWYSFDGTTSNLIVGETASKLNLTGLTPGTYTYYVGVRSDVNCETAPADRTQVTFTILPSSLITDIVADNATICHDSDAVLTPSSNLVNPVFFWYLDENKTQPISNGTISNVTYSISSTGALTASGLTTAMSPITYYVAVASDNTCQNKNGELKAVTVIVNDPPTPTSTSYNQNFCLVDAPTVADLQVNEADVVWYDAVNGGNLIASTTALATGIYYGAIRDVVGCESSVRSIVNVTVGDPGTPVITNTSQDFCLVDAPTVASIDVTPATNIVWYDALSGGNLLASTATLATGTYYAAIKDPTTNCESNVRLAIAISVTDPGTPVITNTTQDFCLVDAPTVANIDVTPATNIVWYDALSGGNLLASTATLTTGTYYAAIKDPTTNCESNVRLAIAINVNDPGTPVITNTTQDFCLVDAPTVASINVSPATNIVWYDAMNGGNLLASTATLTTGTYYAAIKDPTTNCESNVRLAIAISVTDPGTPVITNTSQDFCLVDAPTVASIDVSPATNIVWYDALSGGNLLASTATLATGTYYAAIKDPTTNCESNVRLAIAISVTDPGTPVITNTTQDFCLVDAPTVANIDVTPATNIVWYDALSGGNLLASTATLATGTYYAAIKDPTTNCESNVRLAIAINVNDPGTPVITNTTQDFCLIDAPTVASIDVTPATNIVWYDALSGGNLLASTVTLTTGTYYAAIKDPTTNCESNVRLAIAISVTDPGTPVITNTTQDFCLIDAPTVANIDVTPATNIVWYDAMTGGNLLASTATLTTGTYYAAIKDPTTNCESNVRLAIAISVTDPGTPVITKTTQDFCLVDAPTVASIDVSPATNIVWYDALSGGNLLASTATLTTGTYYAAIKDPTTNCESNVRLAIAISVTDPGTPVITNTTQNFCLIDAPTVASIDASPATNIVWYDALSGGNLLASTATLATGTYYAAIKDPTTNCESNVRLAIAISVTDPGTPTSGDLTQDFCLVDAPTVADIQIDSPTGGSIVWYSSATGGTPIAATTALTTGSYFASILNATTNCESNVRLEVAVSVTDPGTPSLVTAGTQNFCLIDAPTFASIQLNESNIVWYTALNGGTLIPSTNALTNGTYFAAIKNPTSGCESAVRLSVTINVSDLPTPTTTSVSQVFCSGNNPTVADIQVNETNVVWYNAATGGSLIASTTALANGDYYAALKDATTGCESTVRLKVTVTIGNTVNPTTTNTAQSFCSTSAPTIASIQVNESGVTWFSSATGGTAIPATTALTSGIYFGNIVDPITACESSTRLQVTVTVSNPAATPTTTDTTQDFCSINAPTVANIQVNEANVVWYSSATGGTAIPATTALTNGIYYGAVSSTVNCENPVRLAITVTVNTPGVITTPRTTQTFCLSKLPTIANILVNETNVVWYASATGGTPLAANTPLTATTYYAAALNNNSNGCERAARLGVTISFENDALVPITTSDDTPCVFQGVTYSVANGKSNYVWSITNGTIVTGGGTADGNVTVSWSDVGPGTVKVTYINTCDETTTKTLDVVVATCSDLTITNTVNNPTPNIGEQVTFTVTVNNVGEGDFINTLVSDLLPSGYDLVSSSTTAGTYDPTTQVWTIPTLDAGESVTLTIVAEVLPAGNYLNVATIEISTPIDVDATNNSASASVDPICLTVYNEFTPNNDGANDLFRIDCIETFPNNELKVYNRYGALVYSKKHYENDWNGTANVSGVISRGDMLPTGTYFYVIDMGDGRVKKGWLSIMR